MNARVICFAIGAVFIGVGLLGFTPNPLVSDNGIFGVNAAHNVVHIFAGALFVGGALKLPGQESLVLKAMGFAGIAVTMVNFLTRGEIMLWIIRVNEIDRWLHLVLALAVLATGYLFKDSPALRQAVSRVV